MASSFNWWAKERHPGTPMVVKMEYPNWSMVELEGPDEEELIPDSGTREARLGKERKTAHLGSAPQITKGCRLPHFPHFSKHWVGCSCPPSHCLK